MEALRKKYGDNLRFVFKHLPLQFHPQAMRAALYLEAVAEQSPEKAWTFHDKLFENQEAERFGFTGTPGYLINGVPVRGALPPEHFDQIIQRIDQSR